MNKEERKNHWEKIYKNKQLTEVSWYQSCPIISLDLINNFGQKQGTIIDIGGGDSLLVDNLLKLADQKITVLDISAKAIARAKKRLGENAERVEWILADIVDFEPNNKYDLWHDRAAFHFLIEKKEQKRYLEIAYKSLNDQGILIVGTFSDTGPKKCSGIEINQYTEASMSKLFEPLFKNISFTYQEHQTPSGNLQNFIFGVFQKKLF